MISRRDAWSILTGEKKLYAKRFSPEGAETTQRIVNSLIGEYGAMADAIYQRNIFSALSIGMITGLNTTDMDWLWNLKDPYTFEKTDFATLFMKTHGLPDWYKDFLLKLLDILKQYITPDLFDRLKSAIMGLLWEIYRVLNQLVKYLTEALKKLLDALRYAINIVLGIADLLKNIAELILKLLNVRVKDESNPKEPESNVGENVNETKLSKAVYGKAVVGQSYYDPYDLIKLLANDVMLLDMKYEPNTFRTLIEPYTDRLNPSLIYNVYDRLSLNDMVANSILFWDYGHWDKDVWHGNLVPQVAGHLDFALTDASTYDADALPAFSDQDVPYYVQPVAPWQPEYVEAPYGLIPFKSATADGWALAQADDLHDVINILKWDIGYWDGGFWGLENQDQYKLWADEPFYRVPWVQLYSDTYGNYGRIMQFSYEATAITTMEPTAPKIPYASYSIKLWAHSETQMMWIRKKAEEWLNRHGVTSPYLVNKYITALWNYYGLTTSSSRMKTWFWILAGIEDQETKFIKRWEAMGLDPDTLKGLLDYMKNFIVTNAQFKARERTKIQSYKKTMRRQSWYLNF